MISLHVINKSNRCIVVHPDSMSLFSVTKNIAEMLTLYKYEFENNKLIKANSEGCPKEFIELLNYFEERTKKKICSNPKWTCKEPKSLCLFISQDCNLRCGYCYADHGAFGKKERLMDFDTAKLSINKLLGKDYRNSILFFGGEPFLNFSLMREIEEYGYGMGLDISYSTITNGTIMNDAIEKFILEKLSFLGLSLDGYKEINDLQRYGCVESVHDSAVKSIERLRSKYPIAIKCIATSHSINKLADIVDYLSSLEVKSVNIVEVSGIPPQSEFFMSDSEFEIFAEELSDIVSRNLSQLSLGSKTAGVYPVFSVLRLLLTKTKAIHVCSAGREYIAVTADGDVYPCHKFVGIDEFKMGNVHDEDFPGERYVKIRSIFDNHSVYTSEECSSCWARFFCGGDCAARSYINTGNLFRPTKRRCILVKSILEAILPEIAEIFQDKTRVQNLLKSLNAMKPGTIAQDPLLE